MNDEYGMTIAVDLEGLDDDSGVVFPGVLQSAVQHPDVLYLCVGTPITIKACQMAYLLPRNITFIPCSEVVTMEDNPLRAYRSKKNSSLVIAIGLVQAKTANVMIGFGNSGALVAAATLMCERKDSGAERVRSDRGEPLQPAIAALLPRPGGGHTVLMDAGAFLTRTPKSLLACAIMGDVFAKEYLGIASPTLGLLTNGTEPCKGTDITRTAYSLCLDRFGGQQFRGNVEGTDLFTGRADVIVTNGEVGNVCLKTAEGAAKALKESLSGDFKRSKTAKMVGLLFKKVCKRTLSRFDCTESGGMPILGVPGIVIGHGNSNEKAVFTGLEFAIRYAGHPTLHEQIKQALRNAGCAPQDALELAAMN